VLGPVRFGEVVVAAVLMALSSLLAFTFFTFLVLPGGHEFFMLPELMLATAAFVATIPLRRRGASLSSALVGVITIVAFEFVVLWRSASQNVAALGRPASFALLVPAALAAAGVLVAFRVVPKAPSNRRWKKMALW
jgi:hypothetical protein